MAVAADVVSIRREAIALTLSRHLCVDPHLPVQSSSASVCATPVDAHEWLAVHVVAGRARVRRSDSVLPTRPSLHTACKPAGTMPTSLKPLPYIPSRAGWLLCRVCGLTVHKAFSFLDYCLKTVWPLGESNRDAGNNSNSKHM